MIEDHMILKFLGDKPFSWEGIPRTEKSLTSKRVRFTPKEYVKVIKPRLWFQIKG